MKNKLIHFFSIRKLHIFIGSILLGGMMGACSEDISTDDANQRSGDIELQYSPIDLEAAPNNTIPFTFQNYLGNIQNIHPKVLYFENGWNGYRFWMAYTPYPKGKTAAENPCIAVSNDGIDWKTPAEGINPLSGVPESGYNSDTHLVYDEITDRLECWWREYSTSLKRDRLLRRISSDGIDWNEPEIMADFQENHQMRLSPAVSIVDGRYLMLYSDGKEIWRQESQVLAPGIKWEKPHMIDQPDTELRSWHIDMIVEESGKAEIIECAFEKGSDNNSANLYYLKYDLYRDSISKPQLILARSENGKAIDYRSIYRSSIVKVRDRYLIYYSCIDDDWNRFMSLTWGYTPTDLHAYPFEL